MQAVYSHARLGDASFCRHAPRHYQQIILAPCCPGLLSAAEPSPHTSSRQSSCAAKGEGAAAQERPRPITSAAAARLQPIMATGSSPGQLGDNEEKLRALAARLGIEASLAAHMVAQVGLGIRPYIAYIGGDEREERPQALGCGVLAWRLMMCTRLSGGSPGRVIGAGCGSLHARGASLGHLSAPSHCDGALLTPTQACAHPLNRMHSLPLTDAAHKHSPCVYAGTYTSGPLWGGSLPLFIQHTSPSLLLPGKGGNPPQRWQSNYRTIHPAGPRAHLQVTRSSQSQG